jgi:hypothetical protein
MIRIDTDTRGPIFDGRAQAAVAAYCLDAEREVGEEGVNMVRRELDHVLRHPTGHYESQIQTERAHGGTIVTDGDVIYGPWLEGVGSRNQSTRFKGYFTFRKVSQEVEQKAGSVAERVLHKYLGRMR